MIFLFNSSSRSTYLDNIFATLHLPSGAINQYQYSYEGNNSAVDSSIMMNCNIGDEVMISYIDKYVNVEDKVYLPLRKGELIRYEKIDGRIYFDVKLLDYCHAISEEKYSKFVIHKFNRQIYHRRSNGAWKGVLAIKSNLDIRELVESTDDSWIITVKRLSQKKLFRDNYSIFTKLCIVNSKEKQIKVDVLGTENGYFLRSKEKYAIKLSYYIHEFHDMPMTKIHMSVNEAQGICSIVPRELELGNKQSIYKIPIQVPWTDKMQRTAIEISIREEKVGDKQIKYALKPIDLFVISRINPRLRVALICMCIFLLGLSTWISTLPIERIISDTEFAINSGKMIGVFQYLIYKFSLLLNDCRYFYNVICSGITSISTFCLICLYGKTKL